MIQYVCDTCSAIMKPNEEWIVGLAAETVGVTTARREISVQSVWSRGTAVHPLAVHFCSIRCKDEYMARLFADDAEAEAIPEQVAEESTMPAEIAVQRTAPKERTFSKVKVTAKSRSRRKRVA